MTLLDDARRLRDRSVCTPSCCEKDDRPCALHTLEKIVVALEAVYGLMTTEDGAEPIEGSGYPDDPFVWAFCQRPADGPHWEGCLWVKLANLAYRGGST